jgi:hypothetical protein
VLAHEEDERDAVDPDRQPGGQLGGQQRTGMRRT